MINPGDFTNSFGCQCAKDKRGRGPEVRCHNGRSGQFSDPAHDGGPALEIDIGAHALQFEYVHEPVLEYALLYHADTASEGHERHELGLHVCRKARKGLCFNVDAAYLAFAENLDKVPFALDRKPGIAQFLNYRLEMVRPAPFELQYASRNSGGHNICSG